MVTAASMGSKAVSARRQSWYVAGFDVDRPEHDAAQRAVLRSCRRCRSPRRSGQATFDADADLLAAFVDDSYEVVAPGDEHLFMNIDEALSQLMQHEL
ncbi:hypothetical protein [Saccharopolyspora phatthalungensis]|uniref:Uncharacterized protein n=1 Tax=Saccharopolyspora phatthalungensis TaxID=664693 RepID=A0A840Q9Q4_9PSEU|nr:hypothetical protein [Saccharopolyspora phatthalungensis]MBB5157166.1 hypothetical protein [Saccharopolyspora phatthalungensis]